MRPPFHLLITLSILLGDLFFFGVYDAAAAQTDNNSLNTQITTLLNSHDENTPKGSVIRSVKILTPDEQLAILCAEPELSIANKNAHITGNKSVIAQCGTKRKFIQISVQAQGTWWVVLHLIKPGSIIQTSDLQARTGSLEHLPVGLIFNQDKIVGQTATRTIQKEQPLTENQLRKSWAIVVGQEVDVSAIGEGFQIHTKGKALDNAAASQHVRISTHTGQIVTGIATADGEVNINLKE